MSEKGSVLPQDNKVATRLSSSESHDERQH